METQPHAPHTLAQAMVTRLSPTLLEPNPGPLSLLLLQFNLLQHLMLTVDRALQANQAPPQRQQPLPLAYFYQEAEYLLRLLAADYELLPWEVPPFIREQLPEASATLLYLYQWLGFLSVNRYTALTNQLADHQDFAGQALTYVDQHSN